MHVDACLFSYHFKLTCYACVIHSSRQVPGYKELAVALVDLLGTKQETPVSRASRLGTTYFLKANY